MRAGEMALSFSRIFTGTDPVKNRKRGIEARTSAALDESCFILRESGLAWP
jgi:hypothetical protein